jgi:hypothetical protein
MNLNLPAPSGHCRPLTALLYLDNVLTQTCSSSAQLMHSKEVVVVMRDILEFMTTVVNRQVGSRKL